MTSTFYQLKDKYKILRQVNLGETVLAKCDQYASIAVYILSIMTYIIASIFEIMMK